MKNILHITCCLLLLFSLKINAQNTDIKDKKNALKLHIAPLVDDTYGLQYERMLTQKISASLSLFGRISSTKLLQESETTKGIGYQVEGRFYPINYANISPKGMYVGIYNLGYEETYKITTTQFSSDPASGTYNIKRNENGILIGWTWIIKQALTIDLGAAAFYYTNDKPNTYSIIDNKGTIVNTVTKSDWGFEEGLSGKFRFSLGYAF